MTNKEINAAYIGSQEVDKIYLGADLVYGGGEPDPRLSQPLTFNITKSGGIRFKKTFSNAPTLNLQYRINDGQWQSLVVSGTTPKNITVSSGDSVEFKTADGYSYNSLASTDSSRNTFSGTTAAFTLSGNILSMLDGANYDNFTGSTGDYTFSGLFAGCSGLTDASQLYLPDTGLARFCYSELFTSCKSLTSIPALPATTLTNYCYFGMFADCTSLATAPALPATALTTGCYHYMFRGCTSITTAPALPATTLADKCYQNMFGGCTGLTTAPELPATTLAQQCYSNMFTGCTSLTTAPELPATTLVASCYERMFQNCTNLNYINCHIVTPNETHTNYWLKGVAATGTFVKNPDSNWTRSVSGIPSGWTVQDYVDPASIPVLKIAGQSITGRSDSNHFEWVGLPQYSGTSFTIEVGGVPITADTWNYEEDYLNGCGDQEEQSYETGTTRSLFEVNSGYVNAVYYFPGNNFVSYFSIDDQTSDDPQTICECQGGCWDGETCQECAPEDPCDDWEGNGYSSYEECTCAEHGEGCEESDPCDDWEGNGYSSWEECTCAERGENCEEEESGE